jgi:hypothetical protein
MFLSYHSLKTENECGLSFWVDISTQMKYPALYELAQDFVAAPASQAYSERVFSLCGDLTDRKRNRASKTLEKRVFLKMNKMYI